MDVAGKKVLIMGDSHADWSRFGNELEKLLAGAGAKVTRIAIGGSWAPQWLASKPICRKAVGKDDPAAKTDGKKCASMADIQAAGPYDLALIVLGTNDAANADVSPKGMKGNEPAVFVERIKQIVAKIGAPFILVGPPTLKDKIEHYTNEAMAPYIVEAQRSFGDAFFDSRPVTAPFSPKEKDAVHFIGPGGAAWAKAVVEYVQARSPMSPKQSAAVPTVATPALAPPNSKDATKPGMGVGTIAVIGVSLFAAWWFLLRKR